MALNWFRIGEPERGLPLISEASNLKRDALCCHIVNAQILTALGRSKDAEAAILEARTRRPDLNRALLRLIFPHRDRSVADGLADLLEIA
jgi:hypothetical protein